MFANEFATKFREVVAGNDDFETLYAVPINGTFAATDTLSTHGFNFCPNVPAIQLTGQINYVNDESTSPTFINDALVFRFSGDDTVTGFIITDYVVIIQGFNLGETVVGQQNKTITVNPFTTTIGFTNNQLSNLAYIRNRIMDAIYKGVNIGSWRFDPTNTGYRRFWFNDYTYDVILSSNAFYGYTMYVDIFLNNTYVGTHTIDGSSQRGFPVFWMRYIFS